MTPVIGRPVGTGSGAGGFALIGVLALLTVVGLGLTAMVVFTDRVIEAQQADRVTTELQDLYRATVGDQTDTFGFLGDVGDYPASLADLVINPGLAGWSGPYITNARVANDRVSDPWGQPYEYFLVSGVAGSDQLAIVSRGRDGLSTNTASDPNVGTNFTGVEPIEATYFSSDARNADNMVFPRPDPSHAETFDINTDSLLNVTISNFDSNPQVDAFVPACPNFFTLTVTSTARGTDDVPATPYSPGFEATLPQGSYRLFVTSALLPTPPVNDRIVSLPVAPAFKSYNVTGLDSSGTDAFTLTVTNRYPLDQITVASFNANLGTVAANGGVATFTPKGCSTINIKIGGDIVETFTMPHSNFSKIAGATAAAITVTNNLTVNQAKAQVFRDGLFIGDVKKGKTKTFGDDLGAGNVITVTRSDTGALVGGLTLVAGTQTLIIS